MDVLLTRRTAFVRCTRKPYIPTSEVQTDKTGLEFEADAPVADIVSGMIPNSAGPATGIQLSVGA